MTTAKTPPNRYVQILHLAVGILLAVLHSVYSVLKSTYQRLKPQQAKSLQGQVVLVTGAGHGIGRQLALEFWRHGCMVVCVDTDVNANSLTVQDINALHSQNVQEKGSWAAHGYTYDVTDRNQVTELADRVQKHLGHVDILVNNVGIFPVQPTLQVQPADVIKAVNLNLLSNFWTVLGFLPGMIERKQGHIVAISSGAGLNGLTNKVPYSASKQAVTSLMAALSEELQLESHNIKVTCVHPYFMNNRNLPEQLDVRIPELSPEHAASEIVNAVRHNIDTITVPRSLFFWLNVLRTLPQDARDVWRDLFQTRTIPTALPNVPTYQTQAPREEIKT